MSKEEDRLPRSRNSEGKFNNANLDAGDELCAASERDALVRTIFGLALAITTEPSKLGQLRQLLVHCQGQRAIPEDFSSWAIEQIDERVMSMALEYAYDAELLVQVLSFKSETFNNLRQDIEDIYQQEKICQRVYARAKLLLRAMESPQQE